MNKIDQIIENPCDAPWWVYLKTAFPAAADSLWMLIVPQPDEILEEYLDPKKTRGAARRGFQGKWRQITTPQGTKKRGNFDGLLNNNSLIAHYLPGAAWFASRKISALEHIFWTGFNTLERGLWYWLVYSATENFFYEWHSGIMESSCEGSKAFASSFRATRSLFRTDFVGIAPVNPNAWDWFYGSGFSNPGGDDRVVLDQPMDTTLFWQLNAQDETGAGNTVVADMSVETLGHGSHFFHEVADMGPFGGATVWINWSLPCVTEFAFSMRNTTPQTMLQGGDLSWIAEARPPWNPCP